MILGNKTTCETQILRNRTRKRYSNTYIGE